MKTVRCRLSELFKSKAAHLTMIFALIILSVPLLTGASISKYSVLINDETTQTIVFTSMENPKAILAHEGIVLGPYDAYEFSGYQDNLGEINVKRAHSVKVTADDKTKICYVTGGTIGDALNNLSITVDDDDLINVQLSEEVHSDVEISITRVLYQTVEKIETIPYETETIYTSSMKDGQTRVITKGVNGEIIRTVDQKLVDGVVVEESVVNATEIEPVSALVMTGSSTAPATTLIPAEEIELDENGNPVNYTAKYTGKATAYSALGKRTKLVPGCVAMNLDHFPRGTRLYIKTPSGSYVYGYSEVRDTGTALVDNIILVDLFFNSYAESCRFGAKTVDVYVLD